MTGYDATALGLALLFIGGIWVAATTTLMRTVAYRKRGIPLPRLLVRDLWVFGGFATTIALVLLARAIGLREVLWGQLWWLLVSTLPALVGVFVYVWFEIVVIDRVDPDGGAEPLLRLAARGPGVTRAVLIVAVALFLVAVLLFAPRVG